MSAWFVSALLARSAVPLQQYPTSLLLSTAASLQKLHSFLLVTLHPFNNASAKRVCGVVSACEIQKVKKIPFLFPKVKPKKAEQINNHRDHFSLKF